MSFGVEDDASSSAPSSVIRSFFPPAAKSGVPIFDTPWFLSIAFCRSILQNFQQDIQNTSHRGRCDATDNSSYPMTARTLHVKPGVPSLEAMEYLPCTTWEVMNNPVTVSVGPN